MSTAVAMSGLSPAQLQTLKRTVAKELNATEFDMFMELCKSYQLDPFRKQIIPLLHYKDNPQKRTMTPVTTRDGLRVIAARCHDYRPAEGPAEFVIDKALKKPAEGMPPNPEGIEVCRVRLWKQKGDQWFPVHGEAYWNEYAPRGNAWTYSQWPKMPRRMIEKCAEVAALRAGWPESFSGLYLQEEFDHAAGGDETASEALAKADAADREARIGGRGVLFQFDGTALEKVETGKVYDRVMEAIGQMSPDEVYAFRLRNQEAFRMYWADAPGDALTLKAEIEKRIAPLMQGDQNEKV